jgi:23S rRNA (pseudouridine1915-N3)-methyltransferase
VILRVISIGKTKQDFVQKGTELYLSRLKHYTKYEWLELPDVSARGLSTDEVKLREGDLFLKHLKPDEDVVLLDEKGKLYSSRELSQFLQKKMNAGVKSTALLIGGAHGFSPAIYQRAQSQLSLSPLTFPHELIRLFLAEQLYRSFTILKGEGYHHD